MKTTLDKVERPLAIKVICVLGFIGGIMNIRFLFSDVPHQYGSWYEPYTAITSAIFLGCIIGLWMMKKWAAITYIGLVALSQVILIAIGNWSILELLLPGIVIFFILNHFSEMK